MREHHATMAELEAHVDEIRSAPKDGGALEMIVRRPSQGERETLVEGELDAATGLVGDNWLTRGSKRTADGSAHPEMQLNLMNARAAAAVAGERERWPLAGDQLYLDLDLSEDNLPPGSKLALGSAILEITAQPHRGCAKFADRFGPDALRFVNSPMGVELHLRGINARVIQSGVVRVGDRANKV